MATLITDHWMNSWSFHSTILGQIWQPW